MFVCIWRSVHTYFWSFLLPICFKIFFHTKSKILSHVTMATTMFFIERGINPIANPMNNLEKKKTITRAGNSNPRPLRLKSCPLTTVESGP